MPIDANSIPYDWRRNYQAIFHGIAYLFKITL